MDTVMPLTRILTLAPVGLPVLVMGVLVFLIHDQAMEWNEELFPLFLATAALFPLVLQTGHGGSRVFGLLLTSAAVLVSQVPIEAYLVEPGLTGVILTLLWRALLWSFPFLFVHFALTFPVHNEWIGARPAIVKFLYAPLGLLLIISDSRAFEQIADTIVLFLFLFGFIAGVAVFLRQYLYSLTRAEKNRLRLVTVGCVVGGLPDWRQLEFPATTNGIPRFFRADPDHEGMVKDQQVRRLVKLKKNEKTLTMAAAKAGMSRKTARKYLKSGKLPSQCQPERYWRTRSDPFESVWPEVKEILKRSPTVEAKAVFDHLCRQQEGAFQQGQLRTLQRRIKQWKAEYGEAKEVMFPQKYQPGHQAQSDFTFMGRLGVTIQGQPFPHLLYHFVLAYSNWEATTLCFSESFESLSLGLQNALWELGALPEEHRTDRLSAAVKNLKREEFTERYQALLRHFGMRSSRTQAGKAHENGDVEQSHHRLKRAIEQELLLRCSRDFSSREEYEGFVAVIVSRRNAARQKRLGEELAVMRPLPARRLDDFTRQWVRVSPSSTIRVRHNTYSVDSRLIGERVQVRVWADQVEVYYGGRRQARMPRLRGEGKHRIDYRHVIHSLVRKPGAFTRYRWREDLFPGILFRVAYDELRRDCPATADRQYLKILEVAAQEGEQRVREALQVLIERGQRIRFEALRECLVDPVVEPWEVMVEKMDVGLYDTLLENREVRS